MAFAPPAEAGADRPWDQARWQRILDRVEHRQRGIGLKFWGPPLWLEVTMSGPDSELWSVAGAGGLPRPSWNWQSTTDCVDAMRLEDGGADDDQLLAVASRYCVENLILNAAHEIGEWLRFDARRVFASHSAVPGVADGPQGNGIVDISVHFDAGSVLSVVDGSNWDGSDWDGSGGDGAGETARGGAAERRAVSARAAEVAAAWRWAFMPEMAISYGPQGPIITEAGRDLWEWRWSASTIDALEAPEAEFVAEVQRDVHQALVWLEADRVCEAFHVDGSRPWHVERGDDATSAGGALGLSIGYG